MARSKKSNHVSVLNWMGTFILLTIPGVNVIAFICYLFSKNPSKRNCMIASLLMTLLYAAIIAGLIIAFPEQVADLATLIRQSGAIQ